MAYSYDDFLSQLNQSGLQSQFSPWDMDTAAQYPEFGISMIALKQKYNNAATDQERALANQQAEQLRMSYGNYLGGQYGSDYISLGRSPDDYQSRYGSLIDETLDSMMNYGDFSFDVPRPTYESRYQEQMDSLLDEIINRQPHLYNAETDPVWSAYKKQYRREGQRAQADTMAQAAAATGGIPSSYAATAAGQAGNYYDSQMADILPQLYQQSYDRYLNEYQMKQQDLNAVQGMEQMDYGKYIDALGQWNTDRNFAYGQWQDGYNMLSYNMGTLQGLDATEYGRLIDELNYNQQQQSMLRDQQQSAQAAAQAQVDAILAAGGRPSAELIAASGYPQEYIDAMAVYYAPKAAGSGGSGKASDDEEESLYWQIYNSGMTPLEYLYSKGITSQSYVEAVEAGYSAWEKTGGAVKKDPWNDRDYQMFLQELELIKYPDALRKHIAQAVVAGKITPEQGDELYERFGL